MRLALKPHLWDRPPPVRIVVEVARVHADRLALRYVVTGAVARVSLPDPAAPERRDGLWRHSCLEAFVRVPGEEGYWEFNFSPSSQWAAYRFDSHRSGMRDADIAPPRIELPENLDAFVVRAEIEGLPADHPWEIGLAAVIEEESGRKSYWALAHPPGPPDFHHETCFALELPPQSSSPRT